MNLGRLNQPQRISGVAIIVVALAAFLPWVSIFGISASGISGDGAFTLLLALGGLVLLALTTGVIPAAPRVTGFGYEIALLVLAALVALVALLDMNGAAAIGLYLTLLGGIAWVVGAAWQVSLSKQADASAAAVPDSQE